MKLNLISIVGCVHGIYGVFFLDWQYFRHEVFILKRIDSNINKGALIKSVLEHETCQWISSNANKIHVFSYKYKQLINGHYIFVVRTIVQNRNSHPTKPDEWPHHRRDEKIIYHRANKEEEQQQKHFTHINRTLHPPNTKSSSIPRSHNKISLDDGINVRSKQSSAKNEEWRKKGNVEWKRHVSPILMTGRLVARPTTDIINFMLWPWYSELRHYYWRWWCSVLRSRHVYTIHFVQCYFDSKYPDSPIYATYTLFNEA